MTADKGKRATTRATKADAPAKKGPRKKAETTSAKKTAKKTAKKAPKKAAKKAAKNPANKAEQIPGSTGGAPGARGQRGRVPAVRRHELIAEAAYLRAAARGFDGGDPTADWLEAEREIDDRLEAGMR